MRNICSVPEAWEQYTYWHGQDRKTLKRINILIEAAARDPFSGIGKPEPLVANLSGYWSRRIDETNRLVYRATDDELIVVGCVYHYER
jgi:toxin YoeB